MRIFSLLLALVLTIVAIAFAALNAGSVQVNYLLGSRALPLVVLLLIALIMGVLLCVTVMSFKILKLRLKNKKLEEALKEKQVLLSKIQEGSQSEISR